MGDRSGRRDASDVRRYVLCVSALLLPIALLLGARGLARSSRAGIWPYRIGLVGWLAGLGPCSTLRGGTVVLHLRPGGCGPFTLAGVVPSDMPPGDRAIRLPRFPGTVATDRAPSPVLSHPLDAYLQEASTALVAPTGDPQAVADWYADRLARLGYLPGGGSSGVDAAGSISGTVSSQEFTWPGEPERQVQVLVEASGARRTLLLLEAHSPAPPPRPRASLIPPGLVALSVDFSVSGPLGHTQPWEGTAASLGGLRPWHRVVRDGPTLARVARIVNAMPLLTGISSAVPDSLATTLTFRAHDGRSTIFTLAECCAGIRGPGVVLDDVHGTVRDAIAALAPRH